MHVFIDTHLCERRLTGIGRYLRGLVPALLQQASDHTFSFSALPAEESGLDLSALSENGRVRCYTVNCRGLSLRQHLALSRIVRKSGADIYHHPHLDLPLFVSKPSVVTVHDLKYIRQPRFFTHFREARSLYLRRMLGRSLRVAKRIVAISETTRKDIVELFGVPAEKIDVVYHGVDRLFLDGISDNAKIHEEPGRWSNVLDRDYVLFVGERRPHKNLPTLIQAFWRLRQRFSRDLDLVIIGKHYGSYDEPDRLVARLGLESNVHFLTDVLDAELRRFYSRAQLLVLPSYYEGFGLPLLEAMAVGTPVIGSNCASVPEIVGDAGLLFDPNDAEDLAEKMERLISEEGLRSRLAHSGREKAQRFTWEAAATKMLRIYERVLTSR